MGDVQGRPQGVRTPSEGAGVRAVKTNPARLSIELFCRGMALDPSFRLAEDGCAILRTRAGLGSGLELCVPGRRKVHWVNVPIEEEFAKSSPWLLVRRAGQHVLVDRRTGEEHDVIVPPTPGWYERAAPSGTPMSRIGVLQGTYLGIYVGGVCAFWAGSGDQACQFCTTGKNVGTHEILEKSVDDVVATAKAAKAESGVTFVHLNSGYSGPETVLALEPYVRALKQRVGVLVGVQATPAKNLAIYDRVKDWGVDHLSFCYEFHDEEMLKRYCPGKARAVGQQAYFDAIEHTSKLFGRGAVSGEIIAGVEPIETTLRAVDWIASKGAFPTVCIFRPTLGSAMENFPPPEPDDMEVVFRAVWDACRRHHVPVGLAPGIEVSLVLTPDDCADLIEEPGLADRAWRAALAVAKKAAAPVFRARMKPTV